MFDRKLQCKRTYDEYQQWQAQRLLKTMTPEARQHLSDAIQARQVILGEQVQNPAILDLLAKANNHAKATS